MLDIIKLKKVSVISRRMYIINYMANKTGTDIYYLFGLLNMYNSKNKGKWFWQKASFVGPLKDSFDKFNSFMDKFSQQFKSYDESRISANLDEGQSMIIKLITDLEVCLLVNRDLDESSVRAYLDNNLKTLIDQSLKGL
jgi:hypothetical protein